MTMLRRHRPRGEAGTTLVELIVAMGIFTFVTGVFMAGVVVMTRNAVSAQAVGDSGDQLRIAFQRLDKQVRYADSVNLPGVGASGASYVEFRTPATVAASGVTTCTQWKWDGTAGTFSTRSWAFGATTLPPFSSVATDLTAPSGAPATYPFTVQPATGARPHETLGLALQSTPANTGRLVSTQSTFVARNSNVNSPSNANTNGDGASDTPVCWLAGVRP